MSHGILSAFLIALATARPAAAQGPLPVESPAVAPATVAAPGNDWQERLAEAIRRATGENPRVRQAEAWTEAARRRVPQALALPDPEVELGLKDVPAGNPSLSRDDFTMEMLTGRQRLPGRGKRSAERAAATADVEGAAAMRSQEVVEIAADIADAFFRLAESDRNLTLLEEARHRAEDVAASATELYRVGKAGPSSVLQANLETTSLDEQLSSLRAERRAQAARFNALQNLPAGTPVPPIGSLGPTGQTPFGSEVPALADLVARAADRSPAVAAAAAQVRRALQELELARLAGRPDWTLMGYYGRRERFEDFVGVSAAVNLPWAHRRRLEEKHAEKEAELTAARAGVEAVRNQLQGEIAAAYADLAKNREQAQSYSRSILPQAEINYRAAQEAYVVGKVDFLTLQRAAADLDLYRRQAVARESGIGRALAALQKASGLPLIAGTPGAGDPHAEN